MHEHFGAHAGKDPDPALRSYRIDVLIDGIHEAACVALMHKFADLLVEFGLGKEEDATDAQAMLALDLQDWSGAHQQIASALHIVVPSAVPRSPDLGAGYNPN